MTKALEKLLFYCHNDTIMGRRIPKHLIPYIRKEAEYQSFCEANDTMPVSSDLSFVKPKIKGG